jgi:hypothetical protein
MSLGWVQRLLGRVNPVSSRPDFLLLLHRANLLQGSGVGPAAVSMCFSPDGNAIAVSACGVLSLWSTEHGARLSCTRGTDGQMSQAGEVSETGGLGALSWGYHGYRYIGELFARELGNIVTTILSLRVQTFSGCSGEGEYPESFGLRHSARGRIRTVWSKHVLSRAQSTGCSRLSPLVSS